MLGEIIVIRTLRILHRYLSVISFAAMVSLTIDQCKFFLSWLDYGVAKRFQNHCSLFTSPSLSGWPPCIKWSYIDYQWFQFAQLSDSQYCLGMRFSKLRVDIISNIELQELIWNICRWWPRSSRQHWARGYSRWYLMEACRSCIIHCIIIQMIFVGSMLILYYILLYQQGWQRVACGKNR